MISVDVEKILPSPSGLVLGCIVRYGDGGPVRFVQATVPWAAFSKETRSEMLRAFDRLVDAWLDEEPDDAPLF